MAVQPPARLLTILAGRASAPAQRLDEILDDPAQQRMPGLDHETETQIGRGHAGVVGTPTNIEQAKAVPQIGKAKQVLATLFEKLEASKTAAVSK
jgi:hypothetical protein